VLWGRFLTSARPLPADDLAMHAWPKISVGQPSKPPLSRKEDQMSSTERDEIREVIAQTFVAVGTLARALHVEDARLEPTLKAITAHAAAAHPAARDAGLILLTGGKLIPQATTGRAPQLLDMKQQETGHGPCIEAAREQTLICINDLQRDPRWPEFSAEARECGVSSMLCAPLWVNERTLGTLSLYAAQSAAFREHDKRITELFATLAALALAEAQRTDHLRAALLNRDVIGQAKGIIMERYNIGEDAAFNTLSRISQGRNIKLHEIARQVAETRELPDAPGQ
jgi:GAF domain-containing protein